MKTKVLFAAALLLSASSFAQEVTTEDKQTTSAGIQVSNPGISANASIRSASKTTIKSNETDKAAMMADQKVQETKKTVATQKETVTGQARTDVKTTQKIVEENSNGSSDVHADAKVDAGSKSNKVSIASETKPKPASFKVHTQLKGNAGLKIK